MTIPPVSPFRRTGVYLDHNATSPLKPEVKAAMGQAMDLVGNPSSVHAFGRNARRAVEEARTAVAALVGVKPAQVLFTGSGTEANNFALRGFAGRRVVTSAIEHESVLAARPDAERFGVTRDGVADLEDLERRLAHGNEPALVSLMLVNNETGVVQPVAEASGIAHAHGALIHCDAVQAAGRLPLSLSGLGADLMTLSAHKLGGPTGIGALILAEGLEPDALIRGGGQERRKRAGTENLLGIVGFGAAARLALDGLAERFGTVWHVNCHSMPSSLRPDGRDPLAVDFVIGDRDGTTSEAGFVQLVAQTLRGLGYRVAINDPYKGVELLARYGDPSRGRHSIQLEINRRLYMNEETLERHDGFTRLKGDIDLLIGRIADYAGQRILRRAAE